MPKSIAQQLREQIWAKNLSLQYGAGKILAAHLGIREKTARSQLASLTNLKKAPETIVILQNLCEALDLKITIEPIEKELDPTSR